MYISRYEVAQTKVSYKKLFKLLIDRCMKKYELCKVANIFFNSFTKLFNSKGISVDVPVRICIACVQILATLWN